MSRQLVAVTCDRANVAPWIASQHKPCLLRFVVFLRKGTVFGVCSCTACEPRRAHGSLFCHLFSYKAWMTLDAMGTCLKSHVKLQKPRMNLLRPPTNLRVPSISIIPITTYSDGEWSFRRYTVTHGAHGDPRHRHSSSREKSARRRGNGFLCR